MTKWLILGDYENRFLAKELSQKLENKRIEVCSGDYGTGLNIHSWPIDTFEDYENNNYRFR